MKNSILKMIIGVVSLFFLVSCDQSQSTYEYLMQHPAFLQKEAMRCQIVVAGDTQCEVVRRAATDFSKLVFEVQTNPEQFGEKILRAQLLQGARFQEMNEMKKKLAQSTDKKNQLEEVKKSLEQAELAYQAQCSNVKILIAVVAMMRIE